MFKPGDVVRVVEGFKQTDGLWIPRGSTGTVEEAWANHLFLKDMYEVYRNDKFELVTSDQGVAFRTRKVQEFSTDGGKTWRPVPEMT